MTAEIARKLLEGWSFHLLMGIPSEKDEDNPVKAKGKAYRHP
jgi:hypothetical protein